MSYTLLLTHLHQHTWPIDADTQHSCAPLGLQRANWLSVPTPVGELLATASRWKHKGIEHAKLNLCDAIGSKGSRTT